MVDKGQHPVAAEILNRFAQRTVRSKQCDARAKERLPGGDTRAATYFAPYPAYMASGNGCYLFDVDGNKYLDLLNNYTSLIHGHAHPAIVAAVTDQLSRGTAFAMATEAEIRFAEYLCDRVPGFDKIRFVNSGTEAVMAALKAARAFTARPKIAKAEGAYHGSYDYAEVSQASTPENWGSAEQPASVPVAVGTPAGALRDVVIIPFNDPQRAVEILNKQSQEIA